MQIIGSREFNQDVSRAKRAARVAPVFVTDRGRATHVLLSIEDYRRLTGETESIADLLALPAPLEAAGELDVGKAVVERRDIG